MARMARLIVEAIMLHEGREAVLERFSHPFWFQALGGLIGMDWHSSGITTTTLAALKRGLRGAETELGLWPCGGRGKQSRRTPEELRKAGEASGFDAEGWVRASRLVAKVDNGALQDGFQIYLHGFIAAADGRWVVVQQGISNERGTARRYHWSSHELKSFVDAPHVGISCGSGPEPGAKIINLADPGSDPARELIRELVQEGPEAFLEGVRAARRAAPRLFMPARHEVRPRDIVPERLAAAFEVGAHARDFPELLLTPGLGPRTLGSLALIAETIHGRPARFRDPARFSFAHGGKDGHPFPVATKVYDETLRILREAVQKAKMGRDEQMSALQRIDEQARRFEAALAKVEVGDHTVEWHLAKERRMSHAHGGRTAHGWAPPLDRKPRATSPPDLQLPLPLKIPKS